MSYFLRKRGVRSAVVPANFPLGYATELGMHKIRVRARTELFLAGARSQIEDECAKCAVPLPSLRKDWLAQ